MKRRPHTCYEHRGEEGEELDRMLPTYINRELRRRARRYTLDCGCTMTALLTERGVAGIRRPTPEPLAWTDAFVLALALTFANRGGKP